MSLHWKRNGTYPPESPGTHTNGYSTRPTAGIKRKPSANTRYMDMLLDLDSVPRWHNITVAICAWLLLAGFVIFPGTFTSIQNINPEADGYTDVERWIVTHIRNLPLLVVAGVCCGIGALGMIGFWVRWRANYVWVCNRVFMPGAFHALAGLLSTIINVYTAQDKQWSITARISAIVEGICLVICGVLFLFYSNWMLERVKKRHRKEFGMSYDEEGVVEKVKRHIREPSPEPGRVA